MYIKFGDYGCYHYLCTTKQRDLAQLVAHTSGGREVAGCMTAVVHVIRRLPYNGCDGRRIGNKM